MSTTIPPFRTPAHRSTPAAAIEAYVRGKDGNRPHLLRAAFTETAHLTMRVHTSGISFPGGATGRPAIADLLVRRFNQTWENIYTLCIGYPPKDNVESFTCDWLVAMSAKEDGGARAGCGRYDWAFDHDTGLAHSLTITITAMESVACDVEEMTSWTAALPYPWCQAGAVKLGAPDTAALSEVLERLRPRY
jgi:hypothetical protein